MSATKVTQPQTPKRPIPRKLNPSMIEALSLAFAKGNYAITACQLCDIDEKTLYEWLKIADEDETHGFTEDESLYIALSKSLKRSQAIAENQMVELVRDSATQKRDGYLGMTFLERRHPDRWGRRERRDININETKTINITRVEVVMPPGELVEGEARELPEGNDDSP